MWRDTGLWADVRELPGSVAGTLDAADGFDETAALLSAPGVRRIVASGNGAAYYVAHALWLAAAAGDGPEVVAVPSGLLAGAWFRFRPGDRLLAVSSSGEFRDLVEAVEAGSVPHPYAAITATAGSTIERGSGARALQRVLGQRAVTHTQALAGGLASALAVWARLAGDTALAGALAALPEALAAAVAEAEDWAAGLGDLQPPPAAVAFSGGRARGGAAPEGGGGRPGRGRRCPRGRDVGGVRARRNPRGGLASGRRPGRGRGRAGVRRGRRADRPLPGRRALGSAPGACDDAAVRGRARGRPGRAGGARRRPPGLGRRLLPHGQAALTQLRRQARGIASTLGA
jgi:D-arabinose 5-phosphate isomerase GutQ